MYDNNALGLVSRVTYGPNSDKQEYTYNNAGEVTSVVRTIGGAAKTYEYTYDNSGNILQEKENNVIQNTYTYDEINQLKTATDKNGVKTTYTYDVNNNMSSKSIEHNSADTYMLSSAGISAEFTNIAEHTQSMSYNRGNQLTDIYETVKGISGGAETTKTVRTQYAYTNGGNLNIILEINGGERLPQIFNYNERNQLMNHYYDYELKASYTYDSEGLRASKTVGGVTTKYYWDRGYTVNESDGTNFTAKNTIGPGGITARKVGTSAPMYLLKDIHGDTTAVLQNGAAAGTYDYDAFGKETSATGAADNPYRYCGEYTDDETGLIYLRNRYYSPKLGRFISEDPYWNPANMIYGDNGTEGFPDFAAIMQSSNLYAYCRNNQINRDDIWRGVSK